MKTALWWVRRDLRLSDNQALTVSLKQAERVLPIFVLDPGLLKSSYIGEKRLYFLYEGLRHLNDDLHKLGSYLVVRSGNPTQVLGNLLNEVEAEAIFTQADYSPYARRRDQRASKSLPLHFTTDLTVHAPDSILKTDKTPYTIFTPFSKAWMAQPWSNKLLPAPARISTPEGICGEDIPSLPRLPENIPFMPGETTAQRRLADFTGKMIMLYEEDRNRMDLAGTSGLSPYLRFGMLSARQAIVAARNAETQAVDGVSRRGTETWLNELIWREFYIAILYHFPHVRQTSFRPALRDIRWVNNPDDFAAWAQGLTGYPVVDAAMRQLLQTGWMHNRARMITASFLTKDLLVDWRWGERYFMQHLIDGDPAANNGGWQWIAGTGTDAAPYFRIFNPILQSKKFDPRGAFIRQFIPELVNVPDEFIHAPWKMPQELQTRVGCRIGKDYPAPIVDHQWARARLFQAYQV